MSPSRRDDAREAAPVKFTENRFSRWKGSQSGRNTGQGYYSKRIGLRGNSAM